MFMLLYCCSCVILRNCVFVVPSEPLLSEIVLVNSTSLILQWIPPNAPNGMITQYSIQLNGADISNLSSNVLKYTIGGLSPDTVYVLQLSAHTIVGEGPPSNVTITTRKLLICIYIALLVFKIALNNHIPLNFNPQFL